MAELQGYAAKAAYHPTSAWGTAVTLGDGDQVEYATESITPTIALIASDQIVGEALSGASDTGQITVTGALTGMDGKYEGHERFVRDVFGGYSVAPDAPGFNHKFDFALSNQGLFGTLAFEKVVSGPHEIDTFKPMQLSITGAPNAFVKLDVTGIGRQIRTKDPGRTNDSSATWTLPNISGTPRTRRLIKFGHVTVEMGLVTDPPPGTAYCLSGFKLDFNRAGTPVQTTCDGDYSSEPATDTVTITGSFDFPIYDTANDPLVDAALAGERLWAIFTFTHPDTYATSKHYKWQIFLPGIQLNKGYPNVGGKGRVPVAFDFTAYNETEFPLDTDASMPRIRIFNTIADIDDYTA